MITIFTNYQKHVPLGLVALSRSEPDAHVARVDLRQRAFADVLAVGRQEHDQTLDLLLQLQDHTQILLRTERLGQSKSEVYYRPRSRGDNTFYSVRVCVRPFVRVCACVSVCCGRSPV